MNKQPPTSGSGAQSRLFKATFSAGLLAASVLLLSGRTSQASSATWQTNPTSSDWNTAANWTSGGPPNGFADTATFQSSNVTAVSLSADTEANAIVFNAGASAFTITATATFQLTISGTGIANNSGVMQNFVADPDTSLNFGTIAFTNSATAGNLTIFTNNGASGTYPGITQFLDSSTAGNSTFVDNVSVMANGGEGGITQFAYTSTAGNGTFTNNGAVNEGTGGGRTEFGGKATAGNGTFTNNGAAVELPGGGVGVSGSTSFYQRSSASNGVFTNNGGTVRGAYGGMTFFGDKATAGNGIFVTNGGGQGRGGFVWFRDSSSAAHATLIANGSSNGSISKSGLILVWENSSGDTARVELFGEGHLDISNHNAPGVRFGSIEGDGLVFLGANNLTVGSNHLSTRFSGVIQDGGSSGDTGGSLTKIGRGKLTLRHTNTYTGGTTIKHGKLIVNNRHRSGTGSGPVQVEGGMLGGKGRIAGAVTVGTGGGSGAVLAPGYQHGSHKPGALSIESALTFNSDATYEVGIDSSNVTADEVIAKGVTISSGAQFSFTDLGNSTFTSGSIFTVINNTSATPIAGTFSNLPDGSTFSSNGNNFKVNYQSGDGNDLTLTVVP